MIWLVWLSDTRSSFRICAASAGARRAFRRVPALSDGPAVLDDDGFRAWQQVVAPASYARWGVTERRHARIGRYDLRANRAWFSVDPPADLAERLAAVTAPVLVVAGAADAMTGRTALAALAEAFPAGRLAIIDDCGHYPWVEQPAAFRAHVDGFLTPFVRH